MIRGLYTAASGITATMVSSDVVANNLANMGTTGFKKVGVNYAEFGNVMMSQQYKGQQTEVGQINDGVQVVGTQTAFNQGILKQTGNPLDAALEGDGFFTVEDPNTGETFYTRNGAFTQNAEGVITTSDGMLVKSEQGNPLILPQEASAITIDADGLVSAMAGQPAQSQALGKLQITQIENQQSLETQGAYLYKPTANTRVVEFGTNQPSVIQGALETSNVNAVEELVRSITGSRRYESMQKAIRMQDQTLEQTVTQVGRYR